MARPLRLELAGGLYHVTSRGDRREAIYRDDEDREAWLSVLGEVCSRFNWRVHAYCEMTNHYHFVVETPEANLSQGMRQLNGVYTQRFNRRQGLVGHLFQGRFKGGSGRARCLSAGVVPLCSSESRARRDGAGGRRLAVEQPQGDTGRGEHAEVAGDGLAATAVC